MAKGPAIMVLFVRPTKVVQVTTIRFYLANKAYFSLAHEGPYKWDKMQNLT